jgi:hypothetical protein
VAASVRHRARAQRVGSALVALLLALALLTLNFGVVDLVDGFTGFVDEQRNPVLDVGWGALFGIVLPIGLLSQVRHPERRIAGLQQCALVALALGVAGVVGGAWGYLVVAGGLGGTVALLVALHPGGRWCSWPVRRSRLASCTPNGWHPRDDATSLRLTQSRTVSIIGRCLPRSRSACSCLLVSLGSGRPDGGFRPGAPRSPASPGASLACATRTRPEAKAEPGGWRP